MLKKEKIKSFQQNVDVVKFESDMEIELMKKESADGRQREFQTSGQNGGDNILGTRLQDSAEKKKVKLIYVPQDDEE